MPIVSPCARKGKTLPVRSLSGCYWPQHIPQQRIKPETPLGGVWRRDASEVLQVTLDGHPPMSFFRGLARPRLCMVRCWCCPSPRRRSSEERGAAHFRGRTGPPVGSATFTDRERVLDPWLNLMTCTWERFPFIPLARSWRAPSGAGS